MIGCYPEDRWGIVDIDAFGDGESFTDHRGTFHQTNPGFFSTFWLTGIVECEQFKMKKEQLEALQVHLTGNEKKEEVEEQEECRLYDLIDVGLKAGRYIFFGLSYSIIPSEICNDFSLKSYRRLKV